MKIKKILFYLFPVVLLWPGPISAQVTPTTTWADYAGSVFQDDGVAIPPGAVVEAYDPDGILCGSVTVGTEQIPPVAGLYGFLHVYGDDPFTTGIDEGAETGDTITFYIDGIPATPSVIHTWSNQSVYTDVDLLIPNQKPVINPVSPVTMDETDSISFAITATDPYDTNLNLAVLGLPPGAVFNDQGNGTGLFTWQSTYDDSGHYHLSFITTDTGELTDTVETNITVNNINRAPQITTTVLVNAVEDNLYADTIKAMDADGDPLIFNAVDKPDWMNVGTDGSLSGIPQNSDVGAGFDVIIEVTDGNGGFDTLSVTIGVINTNDAPQITTLSLGNGTQDISYQDSVKAIDDDDDPLVFSALVKPDWMNVAVTGQISGTPGNADVGSNIPVEIMVTDNNGGYDTLATTIEIVNTNDPPYFITTVLTNAREDEAYLDTVKATDIDGDPLSFSAMVKPDWMNVSTDGILSGTAENSDVGANIPVQIRVSDNFGGYDTLSVAIDVLNANDAPYFTTSTLPDARQDAAYADTLKAIDIDGDPLSFSALNKPVWMSVSAAGILSGTPGNSDVGTDFPVHVRVSDGFGGFDTLTTTIDVININDPPQFTTTVIRIAQEDLLYTDTLKAMDIDNDPLTFSALEKPDWMSLTSTGTLSGKPENNDVGQNIPLRFIVSDGNNGTDTLTTTIDVLNTNDPPLFTTLAINNATEDILYADTLFAVDPDADTLRFYKIAAPPWMNVSSTGILTGLPLNEHVGTGISAVFRVTDGNGASDTLFTLIDVINTNDAPETFALISPADSAVTDSFLVEFRWRRAHDDDGDPLTYTLNINGPGVDTTITALTDTTFTFDGNTIFAFETNYQWFVEVTDGLSAPVKSNTGHFQTPVNTAIDESALRPTDYTLRQNYPNPFNPSTTISYQLPVRSQITIEIYDLLGRRVRQLINALQPAGQHQVRWEGENHEGKQVSSGVYIYTLIAKRNGKIYFRDVKRMLLLK